MKTASQEIAASAHESAAKTQSRALALLTELEQFIGRALSGTSAAAPAFKNDQVFKLPPRTETPAGELEKLAAEQDKIAQALAGNASPGAGEPASAEGAVATAAAGMADNGAYSAATRKQLAQAGEAAGDAARQLGAGDRAAARVPAATAQRALALASETQEKAGRAAAVAQLEQLRHSLNAATRASAGERTQQLAAAQSELRTAAVEQQRTGSAEAADALAQLAELISGSASAGRRASAKAPNSVARAREVADAAAHAQVLLTPHAAAVSRAVRQLQRTSEPLRGGSGAGSAPGADAATLELASQEAAWIASDGATIALAQELAARAGRLQSGDATDSARRDASAAAEKLAAALERGRDDDQREAVARSFNPADVDPQYREAVEAYFERLSREARRGPVAVPSPK
jgi:chromosome segregation protein